MAGALPLGGGGAARCRRPGAGEGCPGLCSSPRSRPLSRLRGGVPPFSCRNPFEEGAVWRGRGGSGGS